MTVHRLQRAHQRLEHLLAEDYRPLKRRMILAMFALALAGCDRRAGVANRVQRIGPETLRIAVQSLPHGPSVENMAPVPRTRWPDAISRLEPQHVSVDATGAYLQMHSFFVAASGVYVPFDASAPPDEGGADPTFVRLWDRVYWYEFTG